jgi:nucleotide-binding universal stress UspA family protein
MRQKEPIAHELAERTFGSWQSWSRRCRMSELFERVIVGYDASPESRDALRLGSVFAKATDAGLVVAAVGLPGAVETHLEDVRRQLPYGARPELVPIASGSVSRALSDLARTAHADLVVLGTSGHSPLELAMREGLADRLIHGALCAVAVASRGYRDDRDAGLRVIGVAYDGSLESCFALERAEALALRARASLRLIGVVEPVSGLGLAYGSYGYGDPSFGRDALYDTLERAADSLSPDVRAQTILASGRAADEIVRRAGVLDLLVTGSHCRGQLRRVLLGGVSTALVHAAPCPVLVVPRGTAKAGEGGGGENR